MITSATFPLVLPQYKEKLTRRAIISRIMQDATTLRSMRHGKQDSLGVCRS